MGFIQGIQAELQHNYQQNELLTQNPNAAQN